MPLLAKDSGSSVLPEWISKYLGDPDVSDIGSLMGPIGTPVAMTRFLTKALREKAFESFWPKIIEQAEGPMKGALSYMASKYPRQMAHIMKLEQAPLPKGSVAFQEPISTFGPYARFSKIGIDPKKATKQGRHPVAILAHELRHSADQMRMGARFNELYKEAAEKYGYRKNPFEVASRKVEESALRKYLNAGKK